MRRSGPIARRTALKRGPAPQRKTRVRSMSARASARERRAADKAWSLAVRQRAGNRCERCGDPRSPWVEVDAHHLISRRVPAYRHDVANGIALCRKADVNGGCHGAAHHQRAEFRVWLREFLDGRPVDERTPFLERAAEKETRAA